MRRRPAAVLLAAFLLVPGAVSAADATHPPSPAPAATSAEPQNGGVIDGTVTGVDYQRALFTVATSRGTTEISVMPTTSVLSPEPGYHTFSDVVKGAKVQVFTSKIGGKLVAQIIRLVKR
jgi:hypothetical protein